MGAEEGDGEAIHAEGSTAGVRRRPGHATQSPCGAKVVLVIVEAHTRGRLLRLAQRDEQFELERLLELADGHDLPSAAEERIACRRYDVGKAELFGERLAALHPACAESQGRLLRTHIDILPHAERLQAVEVLGWLVPKAI